MSRKQFFAVAFLMTAGMVMGVEVNLNYERLSGGEFDPVVVPIEKSLDVPGGDYKLPSLNYENPVYALVELRGAKRLLVLDSESKDDIFFNRLYFDANGNNDLTDDSLVSRDSDGSYAVNDIKISDGLRYSFVVTVDYMGRKSKKPSKSAVKRSLKMFISSNCWYKGEFEADGKNYHLHLADLTANGRFDDSPAMPDFSKMKSHAAVEVLADGIAVSTEAEFDAGNVLSYGDTLVLGSKTYRMNLDMGAGKLALTPIEDGLGAVAMPMELDNAGLFTMAGGSVVMYRPGKTVSLPAGKYQVYTYRALKNDEQGDLWAITAAATKDTQAFSIDKGGNASIGLGEPFVPFAEVPDWSADGIKKGFSKQASIEFNIVGAGKEVVTEFMRVSGSSTRITMSSDDQSRPVEPSYKVLGKDGTVVVEGQFKYG